MLIALMALRILSAVGGLLVGVAAVDDCVDGACGVVDEEVEVALEMTDFGDDDAGALHLLQVGGTARQNKHMEEHEVDDDDEASFSALELEAGEHGQWTDARCKKQPEGKACIPAGDDPKDDPKLWTHYTYCSGVSGSRYRLSGVTNCAKKRGAKSRCKMTGSGLEKAQCDDPFCRTRPPGRYCYGGSIVLCEGDKEPFTVERCYQTSNMSTVPAQEDDETVQVECRVTNWFGCEGGNDEGNGNPHCEYQRSSTSCDIRRRTSRRRGADDNGDNNDPFSDSRRRGWDTR